MPNLYRTTDEIVAARLEDGKQTKLQLRDMNLFASGAFSNVYKGVIRTDSDHLTDIVVKKTWPRQKKTPIEVRILAKLNRLKHKNIVRLLYSYQKEHDGKICLALIFEYLPLNLHQYLKQNNRQIDIVDVKMITWQLFRGQWHLQRMDICHRDIKPQNLLFNADTGLLKISDFGSSAFEAPKTPQPSYHVTRYYRPPELLLGSKQYGSEIDIWSCACVFGEMLRGCIFFPGKNSNNQAEIIFDVLGKPTMDDLKAMRCQESKFFELWQDYEPAARLPSQANFDYMTNVTAASQKDRRTVVLNSAILLPDMKQAVGLMKGSLVYNPQHRLNGSDFLLSPFFEQIFAEGTIRSNGKRIGCLTAQDLKLVKVGDKTVTGTDSTEDNNPGT